MDSNALATTANGTLLGFDFGLRRIGVAVGQSQLGTARPLLTLNARDGHPDWAALEALIEQWRPCALVVGLPLDTEGGEQAISARARAFARQLVARSALPVHLADERYSSNSAQHLQRERRSEGRARRTRSGDIDKLAAAIILEAWFREPTPAMGDNGADPADPINA